MNDNDNLTWIRITDPTFKPSDYESVAAVLSSGWVSMGTNVSSVENLCGRLAGTAHAVAVSSCSIAQLLVLRAWGVGPGSEVVTTPLTWPSIVASALELGATVRYADVDEKTWCLSVDTIAQRITSDASIIGVVHFGGSVVDLSALAIIFSNCQILEDAAHVNYGRANWGITGSGGDAATVSFGGPKMITGGEGGVITTDSGELAESLRLLRNSGEKQTSLHKWQTHSATSTIITGSLNHRMPEVAAALVASQLDRYDQMVSARHMVGKILRLEIERLGREDIQLQDLGASEEVAPFVFPVLTRDPQERDELLRRLREARIEAGRHYPLVYQRPAYVQTRWHNGKDQSCPVAESIASRIISIPCHQWLSLADVERIVSVIAYF